MSFAWPIVSDSLDVVPHSRDDIVLQAARMRHALHSPLTSVQGLAYLLIEQHQDTAIADDLRCIDAARRETEVGFDSGKV